MNEDDQRTTNVLIEAVRVGVFTWDLVEFTEDGTWKKNTCQRSALTAHTAATHRTDLMSVSSKKCDVSA